MIIRTTTAVEVPTGKQGIHGRPAAPQGSPRGPSYPFAFTMIELLVVIAILVVLAALLLPVLSKAKASAQRARCVNNQKQLALVWQMYGGDNDDLLPANGFGIGNLPLWVQGSTHENPEAFTNQSLLLDPQRALFASYLRNAQIYKCPSDRGAKEPNNTLVIKNRSYALNGYMAWVLPANSYNRPEYLAFFKSSDLAPVSPSGLFVFQDVHPDSLCMPAFVVYMGAKNFFHLPASYHNRAGVLAFADGHTDTHHWQDPRTVRGNDISAPHGEFSLGNTDLAWLQDHTTQMK